MISSWTLSWCYYDTTLLSTFGEVNEFSFWGDMKPWGLWKDCDKQTSKVGPQDSCPLVYMLCVIPFPWVWLILILEDMMGCLSYSNRRLIQPDTNLVFKRTGSFQFGLFKPDKSHHVKSLTTPLERQGGNALRPHGKGEGSTWAQSSIWPYQCSRDIDEAILDTSDHSSFQLNTTKWTMSMLHEAEELVCQVLPEFLT